MQWKPAKHLIESCKLYINEVPQRSSRLATISVLPTRGCVIRPSLAVIVIARSIRVAVVVASYIWSQPPSGTFQVEPCDVPSLLE